MKTSNRILLIFFINIFLIPLCLFMGYSTLIRKDKYTLVKNIYSNNRSGSLGPAHTVKLLASQRELICNVEYGDSVIYKYHGLDQADSLSIYTVADTLFIKYAGTNYEIDEQREFNQPVTIDLKLPQLSSLIIEQGRVNILSLDTKQPQKLTADVYGSGILNLGESVATGMGRSKVSKHPFKLDQLSFKTNNGWLEVAEGMEIRSLQLHVEGNSSIELDNGSHIEQIEGYISDSTRILANWEMIKRILPLTTK